ncbi:hypothetical protein [Ottowia sp.]|uniref:hypothetical protein n=1 Tax=Ottowia sp. TaxID=1898956 RepID=UPI0025FDDFFC|nr:hypothetical protein [Ottowia sp.]MBK6616580.1 hypothetical protein [Ottowia sp.]
MDPVIHGIQPMPQAYDEALSIINIVRNGGRVEDLAEDATWRSSEVVVEWAIRMQAIAARRPNAPLIKDIRRMLPVFFEEVIEPHLGESTLRDAQSRRTDDVIEDILAFDDRASRLPSFFAADVGERRLASWLMRWDKGLTGRLAQSQERIAEQTELLLHLREAIGRADAMDRRAEWHWWSMCAKAVLNVPGVGTRWHSMVFTPSPKSWSKKLQRNPFHDWKGQTSVDAVELRIEEPWRVGRAIEEVLSKCSDEHAKMRALESRVGPVVGVARRSE